MSSYSTSPPQYGRIARPKGFLTLNDASPIVTHGSGALASLIRNRSHPSLQAIGAGRKPSSVRGRDTPDVEDGTSPIDRTQRNSQDMIDEEDYRHTFSEELRLSTILLGPQMRSQRLIGNSNPRYKWGWRIP